MRIDGSWRWWRCVIFTCWIVLAGQVAVAADMERPRYVFFLIGDGMGVVQRQAGRDLLRAQTGQNDAQLAMDCLPVRGAIRTAPLGDGVTDSAAAGTAMATGHKTRNGIIAMDETKTESFKTLADVAGKLGWTTGILTDVSMDHATPASFYAHQPSRNDYAEIARQLTESDIDYFGGGGLKGQQNQDGTDNLTLAKKQGYTLVRTLDALRATEPGGRVYAFNHRLSGAASLPYAIDRRADDIPLAVFVQQGIRLLANDTGLFMMVEGGKIDWACHANDLGTTAHNVVALDQALQVVLAFYEQHPDDTLIIVTADHETGGLQTIPDRDTTGGPLAAQTVSAEILETLTKDLKAAKSSFDQVQPILASAFGLDGLTEAETQMLSQAWAAGLAGGKDTQNPYGNSDPLATTCKKVLAARAGYKYTTGGHSDVDVPVTAIGVGAGEFSGTMENDTLSQKIYSLITGQPFSH